MQPQAGPAISTSDLSGSTKFKPTRDRHAGKRKDADSMLTSIAQYYAFKMHVGLNSLEHFFVVIAFEFLFNEFLYPSYEVGSKKIASGYFFLSLSELMYYGGCICHAS